MSCDDQKFWAESPCSLLTSLSIVPTENMNLDQKLNAVTRLVIVMSIIAYFLDYKYWYIFLLVGLGILILLRYARPSQKREGFTIPPTNLVGSQYVTTIPPVLGEEFENPPPAYNNYTLLADEQGPNCEIPPTFDESAFPVYGQYYTQTNLQRYRDDELRNQSLIDSTVQINDAFTHDQIQFRNDMTRNLYNRMNREFRNGCFDSVSPIV